MAKTTKKPTLPFDHETTAFRLENARYMARAAHLAYAPDNQVEGRAQAELGASQAKFITANGTQCFIAADDQKIVVAFRGTEPKRIEDWLTDLNSDLTAGPLGGQVHAGFWHALNAVWQSVERTISRFREGGSKSLWFTGHSLGAALATLAVARFRDDDRPVDGLYTFGQPRTGDRTFARNFDIDFKSQAFRFVNNNDVVTRVPTRSMLYSHVGTFKYFTEDGRLVDDISFWNRFLDRMKGRMEDVFEWGTDGLKDHSMDDYLRLTQTAKN